VVIHYALGATSSVALCNSTTAPLKLPVRSRDGARDRRIKCFLLSSQSFSRAVSTSQMNSLMSSFATSKGLLLITDDGIRKL
jgi:hypothetical protein